MHLRRFLAPRWLAGHLGVIAVAVTMVFLGRWQLQVSEDNHFTLQNFGYAIQWWAFTVFALVMWAKILRDTARRDREPTAAGIGAPTPIDPVEAPRAYRSYSMPQSSTAPAKASDSEHAAYNAYLARLAQGDQ